MRCVPSASGASERLCTKWAFWAAESQASAEERRRREMRGNGGTPPPSDASGRRRKRANGPQRRREPPRLHTLISYALNIMNMMKEETNNNLHGHGAEPPPRRATRRRAQVRREIELSLQRQRLLEKRNATMREAFVTLKARSGLT